MVCCWEIRGPGAGWGRWLSWVCRGQWFRLVGDQTRRAQRWLRASLLPEISRYMKLRWCAQIKRIVITVAAALAFAASVRCAARPLYGGVLRVELRASSVTLNPSRWKPGSLDFAANGRLAGLIF